MKMSDGLFLKVWGALPSIATGFAYGPMWAGTCTASWALAGVLVLRNTKTHLLLAPF